MELKEWIKERAEAMAKRPLMFALTKEAYINSFAMLTELSFLPNEAARYDVMAVYKPISYGNSIKGAGDPVTEEFAKEVSDIFYDICPQMRP